MVKKINKFIGVIPARGGSKRLPNKNLKLINDISLTELSIIESIKSNSLSELILSSDLDKILDLGKKYKIILDKRDQSLARDESTTLSLLKNLINKYSLDEYNSAFVLLQPTSPLRLFSDIDKSIQLFHQKNADSIVSVTKIPDFLSYKKIMKVDENNKILKISFDQNIQKDTFLRNGPAVLVTKLKNILNGSLYGEESYSYEMPFHRSIDIDEEDDFLIAKVLYQKYIKEI
tara:strand:+ start:647 stop:1342 length:696 start_codon:yes stop_codon:yes gene_type:complete